MIFFYKIEKKIVRSKCKTTAAQHTIISSLDVFRKTCETRAADIRIGRQSTLLIFRAFWRRAFGKLSEKCVKRISNDIHCAVRCLKIWFTSSEYDNVHHTTQPSAQSKAHISKCPEIWYCDFVLQEYYYHFETGKFISKLQITKDYYVYANKHTVSYISVLHVLTSCSTTQTFVRQFGRFYHFALIISATLTLFAVLSKRQKQQQ